MPPRIVTPTGATGVLEESNRVTILNPFPSDATKYLDGTGAYTVPPGTSTGTVTHTGTLTSGKLIQGNGTADVTINATTATVTKLTSGTPSAATAGTDYTDAAFKTISVSGQSDVVADSAADTLTLAAGSGVTITTNAGTDTVTIAASGTGNVTTSATLTANQIILGNGTVDIKNLGSLGTTTTVLHGNVAGAPTFGAVSLTADVSGTLPVGNGGTGITSGTDGGILGFTAAGTIASSGALTANRLVIGGGAGATPSVVGSLGTTTQLLHGNAAGAPTFSAVSLTADVSGVLPVANGGTNASSASITAFNNITGYTAAGATGTTSTNLVFSTSPTLMTPILGTPTSGTLTNCTGLTEAGLTLADNTTDNVSTSAHGFYPKLTNTADSYMDQTGVNRLLPRIIKNSGTASSTTNSASETNLIAVQLPVLDANTQIEIQVVYVMTGTNSTRSVFVRHNTTSAATSGGTLLQSTTNVASGGVTWNGFGRGWNANSVSAQNWVGATNAVLTVQTGTQISQVTGSINTGAASYINLNGAVANSGDTIAVQSYKITITPGV